MQNPTPHLMLARLDSDGNIRLSQRYLTSTAYTDSVDLISFTLVECSQLGIYPYHQFNPLTDLNPLSITQAFGVGFFFTVPVLFVSWAVGQLLTVINDNLH